MSDRSGEWVKDKLIKIHDKAYNELGVSHDVEPTMTLCFMSLPVIPEVKITDMGLFDVTKLEFINVEAEKNWTNAKANCKVLYETYEPSNLMYYAPNNSLIIGVRYDEYSTKKRDKLEK